MKVEVLTATLVAALALSGCSLLNQGTPTASSAAPVTAAATTQPATTQPATTAAPATTSASSSPVASPTTPAATPTTPTPAPEPSTPVVTVTVQGTTTPQARTQVTSSDVLDTAGLGPLQLNLPFSVLKDRGYIVATPADPCLPWQTSKQLRDLGVEVQLYYPDNHLGEIALTTATIKTRSGATVGMTVAKIKQIYGSRVVVETKNGNGGPFQVLTVKDVAREVAFIIDWAAQPVSDGDVIRRIQARAYSKDMFGGC